MDNFRRRTQSEVTVVSKKVHVYFHEYGTYGNYKALMSASVPHEFILTKNTYYTTVDIYDASIRDYFTVNAYCDIWLATSYSDNSTEWVKKYDNVIIPIKYDFGHWNATGSGIEILRSHDTGDWSWGNGTISETYYTTKIEGYPEFDGIYVYYPKLIMRYTTDYPYTITNTETFYTLAYSDNPSFSGRQLTLTDTNSDKQYYFQVDVTDESNPRIYLALRN